MSFKLSFAVLLFAFAEVAFGQVILPGKCPDAKVMDEFNLKAYTGLWYEYAKYPFFFEINQKCITAEYSDIGNNRVGVVNTGIEKLTNLPVQIEGYAEVLGPARLGVVFFNENADDPSENYTVLGTDYETYALVFTCSEIGRLLHIEFLWILTRERNPSEETIATAKQLMAQNGISEKYLLYTQQDGCPVSAKYY